MEPPCCTLHLEEGLANISLFISPWVITRYFSCIGSLVCLMLHTSGRRLAQTEGTFCVELFTLLNPSPPSPQQHQLMLWHMLWVGTSVPLSLSLLISGPSCKNSTPRLAIKYHDLIFDAFSPGSVCTAAHRMLGDVEILPQLFLN